MPGPKPSKSPSLHLLYVEPFYWKCGPHHVLRNLISSLNRDAFAPLAVVPRHADASKDFSELDVPVHRLRAVHNLGRMGGIGGMTLGSMKATVGAVQVALFARSRSIDVIHTNNETCLSGSLGARLAGLPSVVHVHGLGFTRSGIPGKVAVRILNTTADRVIAVSSVVADALQAHGVGSEKVRVVHNGIDTERYRPDIDGESLRREFRLSSEDMTVGMVGALEPRKGQELFLKAAAIVRQSNPSARFFIVGSSAPSDSAQESQGYQQRLHDMVSSLGLQDTLVFTGERNDIPELLSMLDVVVQPSTTEAGPLVPLESMSTGKPVVVTDVGANPEEVLHQQTGIVIPPENPHELAQAIYSLLADGDLRARLGAAGRRRVEQHFSTRAMAAKIETIYREVCRVPGQSPPTDQDITD